MTLNLWNPVVTSLAWPFSTQLTTTFFFRCIIFLGCRCHTQVFSFLPRGPVLAQLLCRVSKQWRPQASLPWLLPHHPNSSQSFKHHLRTISFWLSLWSTDLCLNICMHLSNNLPFKNQMDFWSTESDKWKSSSHGTLSESIHTTNTHEPRASPELELFTHLCGFHLLFSWSFSP